MKEKAFTLVEVILVVTILGILGALVLPTFQGHIARARESAAKDNLRAIRTQIELYKLQHKGVPPGYVNGSGAPTALLELQFTATALMLRDCPRIPSTSYRILSMYPRRPPFLQRWTAPPADGYTRKKPASLRLTGLAPIARALPFIIIKCGLFFSTFRKI